MNPRIYTYKVTFEEIPDWYWGVHKEKKFGEHYLGSPVTNKWKWDFYTPHLQILELFPYTEEGWREANQIEDRLIYPDLNNPICLNESMGPKSSIKVRSRAGKIGGSTTRDRKVGVCGRSKEKMSEDGRKGGAISGSNSYKKKTAIFAMSPEEKYEANRRGGLKQLENNRKNKTGLHSLTSEDLSNCGRKGGIKGHEKKDLDGKSTHAKRMAEITHSLKDENGKSVNAVKCGIAASQVMYMDPDHPELGVRRACNLSYMQKSRGYPNSPENRVKVEKEDKNG